MEIIIVDDGSTDNTPEVCAQLEAKSGTAVRVHRQTNQGVSAARNKGIELSSGDFIIFVNADDELLPCAIAHYSELATRQPVVHWMIAASESVRNGKTTLRTPALGEDRMRNFRRYISKSLHLGNISNMCFHRGLFDDLQFPVDRRFGEDVVLFALLLACVSPLTTSRITAREHRREGSLRTRSSLQEQIDNDLTDTLFGSRHLDDSYQSLRRFYTANFARSIAKRAYREHEYGAVCAWYTQMVRAQPGRLLDLKLLFRYFVSRSRA